MILAAALLGLVSEASPLGFIQAVKGNVSIHRTDGEQVPLPKGAQKRKQVLAPGDVVVLGKESALDGSYDGKRLLLYANRSWTAPEKGAFRAKNGARTLLGLREMGTDTLAEPQPPYLFPKSKTPTMYVDSRGSLGLVWVAPPNSKTAQVVVITPDGTRTVESAPAFVQVGTYVRFGSLNSRSIGSVLRGKAREDRAVPCQITIEFDSGERLESTVSLVSRRTARQWDGFVADLHQAIGKSEEYAIVGHLADLLAECEADGNLLAGWAVFNAWKTLPEAYMCREGMRRLAEVSGAADLAQSLDSEH